MQPITPFLEAKKRLKQVAHVPQTRAQIATLLRHPESGARRLGYVLHRTLENQIDLAENKWIDRIEGLRRELNRSKQSIEVVDYGAGPSDSGLSAEEMYAGSTETTTVGTVCKSSSNGMLWSLFLFRLIREFKPQNCLEMGTCLGISGSYQAAALKINGAGTLITMEGAPALADLSQAHFQELGLDNVTVIPGRFADNLPQILAENEPLDYVFIDGHHDGAATIDYFNQIVPHLHDPALLVFDDIVWSDSMKAAWQQIRDDDRVRIALNVFAQGICLLDSRVEDKLQFHIPIHKFLRQFYV